MTIAIILANAAVFLWELMLTPYHQNVGLLGFLWELFHAPHLQNAFVQHYAMVPDHLRFTSLLTSMFLHASWLHLISNMWFLWVFGSHIEDVMGSARFLLFYLCCGIASGLVQLATTLHSPVPTLGASGAIAGVMGAFLVLYPRIRVNTLIFIFVFVTIIEIPAAFILIYWFVIQLVSGFFSSGNFNDAGGTAWFAHIGGFLTGLLLIRLFPNTRRYFY